LAKGTLSQNKLGQVKDFSSLVIYSQEEGKSFFTVTDGAEGQKQEAKTAFTSIANNIIAQTKGHSSN